MAASGNALWFTVASSRKAVAPLPSGCPDYAAVGRITTDGAITEFQIRSRAAGIAIGPSDSLWFTQEHAIGNITADGSISTYPVDKSIWPSTLVAASDGSLWFTDGFAATINHVTITDSVRLIGSLSVGSNPGPFTIAPSGTLFFTDADTNTIDLVTSTGTILEHALSQISSFPFGITVGSDGAIWFPEYNADRIGRIAP